MKILYKFIEYKGSLCTGIDKGIANAKQAVIEKIYGKFNTMIDRYDIDFALSRTRRRGLIDLDNGETFDITDMYAKELDSLAESISISINNKIKESGVRTGTIKHTLIYGGGACVLEYRFGNLLKERIKEIIGGHSSIVEKPHLSNSLGFLEKAKVIFEE